MNSGDMESVLQFYLWLDTESGKWPGMSMKPLHLAIGRVWKSGRTEGTVAAHVEQWAREQDEEPERTVDPKDHMSLSGANP